MKGALYWLVQIWDLVPWVGAKSYRVRMFLKGKIEAFYSEISLIQKI